MDRQSRNRCLAGNIGLGLVLAALLSPAALASSDYKMVSLAAYVDDRGGDPLESVNRAVYSFNRTIHEPLRHAWDGLWALPAMEQLAPYLDNLLSNLREPINLANQALVGDFQAAGNTAMRFAVNSTIGIVGLFDFATERGWKKDERSFVDVVCHYGVPPGPFVVVPLFGGAVARDTAAWVVPLAVGYELIGEAALYLYVYRVSDRIDSARGADVGLRAAYLRDGKTDRYAAYRVGRLSSSVQECA